MQARVVITPEPDDTMTKERFEQLTLIVLWRPLTQGEVFELFAALLDAKPELSA